MRAFTCPVCGGKLNIKIGTEYAACDSCGSLTKINPEEAERLREIYRSAERSMRLNSVEGYEEALRQLDSISFIEEAQKTHADCEKRLRDLQANLTQRQSCWLSPWFSAPRPSPGRSGWSFSYSTALCPPGQRLSSSPSLRWRSFSHVSIKENDQINSSGEKLICTENETRNMVVHC